MARAIRSEAIKLGRRRMAYAYLVAFFLLAAAVNTLLSVADLGNEGPPGLPDRVQGAFMLVSTVGVLLALVFGASASGWEFKNRTLPGLLVREPRRGVVWGGKLVVLAGLSAVFALATGLGGVLGTAVGAALEGVPTEPQWPGEAARQWTGGLGQSAGILFAASLLGATLGMLLRSTGGAIGVGLGFLFVVDTLITLVLDHYWKGSGDYVFGSVLSSFGTLLPSAPDDGMSFGTAAFALSIWTAGLTLLGYLPLQRRDVT